MAVSAYTSLLSLKNVLSNVYDRIEFQCPHLDRNQFDPLQAGVDFLMNFLKEYSHRKSQKIQGLWRQISEVASEAEDNIDTHVVNQLYKESQNNERFLGDSTFCQDMDGVIQKIDSIKTELLMDLDEGEHSQARKQPTKVYVPAQSSSSTSSHGKSIVVGFDEHTTRIMDELTGVESNLKVISITGMGGIGKSTLASNIYDNEYIALHFDVRSWTNISQEYVVEKTLRDLLDDGKNKKASKNSSLLDNGENKKASGSTDVLGELGLKLYKKLISRRYLIVLDDVWSIDVWDDLKRFFPNDMNRSRIIVTTRLLDVASSLDSSNPYQMNFLDNDNSWKLLCLKAFLQESCPYPELEDIGKDIAKDCNGLPLTLVVIGSLLASSDMTQEYWEFVANNVKSFRNLENYDHCLEILSLSYYNLPIHLKPCFLSMRKVKGDGFVPWIMNIWIADGFIEPCESKDLKQIAMEYFMDLVNRNLILIREFTYNGEIYIWAVHDLVRDLCWSEYHKEHYMHSPKLQAIDIKWEAACFLCNNSPGDKEKINFPKLVLTLPSTLQGSPSMCNRCGMTYSHTKRLSLVKVMDNANDEYLCQQLVHPTKLQCLCIRTFSDLKFIYPSFFHLLWSLQTLIIDTNYLTTPIVLPIEIWDMPQLRHIEVTRAILTYPTVKDTWGQYFIILKNLYTLSCIKNFMCTEEVVYRIPNLKELEIQDSDSWPLNNSLYNLVNLQKLERLTIDKPIFSLENISFPYSLKKLVLRNTEIPWKEMTVIGSLPNLEFLTLDHAFVGPEWHPVEGAFRQLKELTIRCANLLWLRADDIHFPKLENFMLVDALQLEIPLGIGDIPTLSSIKLWRCSNYVINLVKQIWEEQQNIGNEMLQVEVIDRDGRYYKLGDSDMIDSEE